MPTSKSLDSLKNPSSDDFFVLDIDSTLVTTHQRNQAILEKFISDNEKKYPDDCTSLKQAKCQLGDYGLDTCLERINFIGKDPQAKDALQTYWRENFFSNDFLHSDRPVEGAVEWVQYLKTFGVDFIYLTARHKDTMWDGTLSSLKDLGLPISEKNLYLKEDLNKTDEEYKSELMGKLITKNAKKKMWLIDNEPVVLNKILADHPTVELVWFKSTHSGRMTPPEGVLTIENFIF